MDNNFVKILIKEAIEFRFLYDPNCLEFLGPISIHHYVNAYTLIAANIIEEDAIHSFITRRFSFKYLRKCIIINHIFSNSKLRKSYLFQVGYVEKKWKAVMAKYNKRSIVILNGMIISSISK